MPSANEKFYSFLSTVFPSPVSSARAGGTMRGDALALVLVLEETPCVSRRQVRCWPGGLPVSPLQGSCFPLRLVCQDTVVTGVRFFSGAFSAPVGTIV